MKQTVYIETSIWQDPIIKETRELREEYAAQFNHDPDAIFEDILKRQNQTTRKSYLYLRENPHYHQK